MTDRQAALVLFGAFALLMFRGMSKVIKGAFRVKRGKKRVYFSTSRNDD